MADDKFDWKSLFFNEENEKPKNKEVIPSMLPKEDTRFPTESNVTNIQNNQNQINNPFINEILDVYQKGFDSLNLENFDFFELYKSVVAVGVSNPQSYHMAFTMGRTIKSDLSKEFLLEKSKFYLDEIEKVYAKYDSTGKARKKDLEMEITRNKVNLSKSISDLESQINELQKELLSKKTELSKIDSLNNDQFNEIELKIEANNYAKNKIIESINIVVSGINQYL